MKTIGAKWALAGWVLLAFAGVCLHAQKPKERPAVPAVKDPTATRAPYLIGPEDGLYIRVWEKAELSGPVNVGPDGTISVQLIGEIKAAGLSPHGLEEEIAKRLQEFYKELDSKQVNVQVVQVKSRTFIIQGEVNRPGVYPITKPLTMMEALVYANGFGPFANKKKIYLLRGTEKHYFNWVDVSKGRRLEQNIEVQNGDQIFVN